MAFLSLKLIISGSYGFDIKSHAPSLSASFSFYLSLLLVDTSTGIFLYLSASFIALRNS